MRIIINEYGQRVLIPTDGKWLLSVDEYNLPEEELPIEDRNYTQAVYIADVLTLEDCEKLYIETDMEVTNV